MLLAYFGPETVLPLTSVIAAVAGFVMMFGRQAFRITRFVIGRMLRFVLPASEGAKSPSAAPDRNLRKDGPVRSRYPRPSHNDTEVRS